MMILAIRTDQPRAELAIYQNDIKLASKSWIANRQLAETIHSAILKLLESNNLKLDQLDGLVIYKGPGSFTGLRIGFSVANALAYSLGIKIAATGSQDWQQKGVKLLMEGKGVDLVLPEYGRPPHITKPRK